MVEKVKKNIASATIGGEPGGPMDIISGILTEEPSYYNLSSLGYAREELARSASSRDIKIESLMQLVVDEFNEYEGFDFKSIDDFEEALSAKIPGDIGGHVEALEYAVEGIIREGSKDQNSVISLLDDVERLEKQFGYIDEAFGLEGDKSAKSVMAEKLGYGTAEGFDKAINSAVSKAYLSSAASIAESIINPETAGHEYYASPRGMVSNYNTFKTHLDIAIKHDPSISINSIAEERGVTPAEFRDQFFGQLRAAASKGAADALTRAAKEATGPLPDKNFGGEELSYKEAKDAIERSVDYIEDTAEGYIALMTEFEKQQGRNDPIEAGVSSSNIPNVTENKGAAVTQ